jgi:carboxyl-terminal processing protease
MQYKVYRYILAVAIALVLLGGAFSGGVMVGWAMPSQPEGMSTPPLLGGAGLATASTRSSTPQTTDTTKLFAPFWEAWSIVHDQYVDQPVDDLKLMRGAISGMMQALGDKHTSYMDPDEYKQANTQLGGEYEGIGAYVDVTGDFVKIVSPMKGSPAEKAGLLPNDAIIAVDGTDMTGISGELVLKRILGPAGTKVTLTISRPNVDKPFDVTLQRAKIVVPEVEGKMLDNNIAYIKINTFGDKTTDELLSNLKTLNVAKSSGLIVDLRNNGGGYLTTAIEVVSQFIDSGKIVMYEQYGDGTMREYTSQNGGLATKIPLVVLVNQGTASASEITAGAIQDYGRAKLVGVTTYGKGSVQNWIALKNNAGAVRVTVARWLTPEKRQINEKGLKPDVVVEMTADDVKAKRDPQLDKAVEILTSSIK